MMRRQRSQEMGMKRGSREKKKEKWVRREKGKEIGC